MKIAIIGATGHAGSFILQEAVNRGIEVTAIVRHPEKLATRIPYLQKNLFDLTTEDLQKFDVVVDAFNAPQGKEELHQTSINHLLSILAPTTTRLLVVGGASSLFIDEEKTQRMIDGVPTDAPFYPTAHNMYLALLELKKDTKVNWTYLSPAAFFNPDGQRTGTYQLNDDRLIKNAAGKSEISMADYAIALLDEIENQQHVKEHISVVSR
ncbi:NAD(P)-dependent oxidoreductase [Enterococcus massiliensis]|uniref:NAD(P)-dependent oxidoreductase n=1 Tax=Enterococcus massiliensis TaxID=1640685 RepID=UPI00065E7654|nr:NAD(P)-dependent oxidoreductase [Enterococcus massiliensis]